ncbi:MAG: hypothetical protein WD048_11430 [Chitinophagales bacterium]
MQGVRHDGDAVGKKTTHNLETGKTDVYEEGNLQIFGTAPMLM